MKNLLVFLCVGMAAGALAGCGAPGGLLIQAVPTDQRLVETTVARDGGWFVADKIAVIDVEGLLVNEHIGGLLTAGENPVTLFIEKLDRAQADPAVKAVVLRINSPGGTVQATQLMAMRLARFRRCGKPVIASILDVGASGGYYLACGSQKIYCLPTAITGSIGVIMQTVSFAGTMKKLGISADAIVSGPFKDIASPLRDLGAQERQILQAMVLDFYGEFLAVVAASRKNLAGERVRELADGRVYTGQQAMAVGLVDALGDVQDALCEARTAASLRRAKVVMYHRPLGYKGNVYAAAPGGVAPQVNLLNVQLHGLGMLERPSFLYLWTTDAAGR